MSENMETTEMEIERPEIVLDAEKVTMLDEIEKQFVSKQDACDLLGIRSVNQTTAFKNVPEYTVFGKSVYAMTDVEQLAEDRFEQTQARAAQKVKQLEIMQTNMIKAQEKALVLAARIEAAKAHVVQK